MVHYVHCGTFLLFCAVVLLVVATISAPVVDQISFLNIYNGNQKSTFGVFGYCTNVWAGQNGCSQRMLGYNIAQITDEQFNYNYANKSLEAATKGFVLHPVAAGIAFLAFLVAACSDHIGYLFAALITLVAFFVSLVAMILDFVIFGIIRNEINNTTGASASFSTAIWLTLAATIVLFFSTFIVCFSCCGARRNRDTKYVGNGYNGSGGGRQWWGNRY